MKKITLVIVLAITTTSTIFAQEGKSYLMMNFGINQNIKNFRQPFFNTQFDVEKGGTPFGIQWIRSAKHNSAWRFGLEISKKPIVKNGDWEYSHDTSIYNYSTSNLIIPRVTLGKEFRKQIHKDVMIYGGADIGVGLLRNLYVHQSQIYVRNAFVGGAGGGNPKTSMSVSARPFMGIRTDWHRFVIGYEASLPVSYTQVFGEGFRQVDGFKFQHQISVGYQLGKKKN